LQENVKIVRSCQFFQRTVVYATVHQHPVILVKNQGISMSLTAASMSEECMLQNGHPWNYLRLQQLLRSSFHRRILLLLACCMVAFSLTPLPVQAGPGEAPRDNRRIAILVQHLLDRRHLSDLRVDDETSHRCLAMFFKTLDPRKLYFLQSDIDEFSSENNRIDNYIKNGDTLLSNRIFHRFMTRVNERVAAAQNFLDQGHDFTVDEEMVYDPDSMTYAATQAEADDRWRKRVKYDLLTHLADGKQADEAVEKLHKRYRSIGKRWQQTDNDELLEMYLSALTLSFDPHSSYMSPSTLENFTIQMRLELNGIGASLESKYGETIVRRIVPGGAADKDGRLKVGDKISGVAQGSHGEMIDIIDMKINNVVQLIRGKPGTIVRLEVEPESKSGLSVLDITRARIELKDSEARSQILEWPLQKVKDSVVKSDVNSDSAAAEADQSTAEREPTGTIVEHGKKSGGGKYRIGVVDLPSFYMDMEGRRAGRPNFKSTSRDVRRLLEQFNRENIDLVIMDLRFNGGGSLPESVDTTGLFIDKGPVVQVKGPNGRVTPYQDDAPGAVWKGPLIVLTNKFSASASEIFAGAIQDYGRGIIIGDHSTHGKGTVQQLFELGPAMGSGALNLGALKLTIQQFYRPSGDSTQNRGVVSDVELPSRITHWEEIGESSLDYALKFDQVAPLQHDQYHESDPPLVQELNNRSRQRRADSDFFTKEDHKINRFIKRQKDSTVTLNREKFLAERAEENTEKEQADIFNHLQDEDRPVFAETPYNEEVLAIAIDYLQLLRNSTVAKN
jgi:carboxyl-terminal processing protease